MRLTRQKKNDTVVGLDIEASSIAATEIRVNGSVQVAGSAVGPLAPGAFHEGEVLDADALAAGLKSFFAEHKLAKQVRLGIANQRVVVRTLRLPAIENPKELEAAVRFQAQEQMPMPIDQAVLEHQVVGGVPAEEGSTPQLDVVVVAARRDMVGSFLEPLRRAGLEPIGIDLSAFAMIRALAGAAGEGAAGADGEAPTERIDQAVLYCHLGDVTNLAVARGRACLFTRVSQVGSSKPRSWQRRKLDIVQGDAAVDLHIGRRFSMRSMIMAALTLLCWQLANGQLAAQEPAKTAPSAAEIITKFRKTVGEIPKDSPFYLIKYRGERFLYSQVDGRLQGDAYPFEITLLAQTDSAQKYRKQMETKIGIVPLRTIEVLDGESGWIQINDSDPVKMTKDLVDGRRQREFHIEVFLGQESFEPSAWKFTEVRSTQVRGDDAWEFDAKTSGLEPITLTFDKKTGLMKRLKTRAADVALLPGAAPKLELFTRELHFYDWKSYGSRMMPAHLDLYQDGVLWKKLEPVSLSFPKTIDAKLFAMPTVSR